MPIIKNQSYGIFVALSLLFGAITFSCSSAGMGKALRGDVRKQMGALQDPVGECYKEALHSRSRRIQGTMVLRFKIEPKTGKFKDAAVANSDVSDTILEECVVSEVNKLVLTKPQETVVGVDTFPLRFSPSN